MNKCREDFEKWAKSEGLYLTRDKYGYVLPNTAAAWEAWCYLSNTEDEAPNIFWVLFDTTSDKKYIKKLADDGSLLFYDTEDEAMHATRLYPGTDYQRVEYYTHPAPQVAGWRSGYPEHDGDGGVCHIPLSGHPDFMVVAFNSDGNLVDSCGDDVGYSLDDVERWKPIDTPIAPQVAVPEGWTDRHTRVTRFALWGLINEGYHRANAAAQKGQPGTADDIAALLDDVKIAEEARNMLTATPTKGEEIHVNVDGDSVYTLPLESTGMAAPRFVVHVPAPDEREIAARALDEFRTGPLRSACLSYGWDTESDAYIVDRMLDEEASLLRAGEPRQEDVEIPGDDGLDIHAPEQPVSDPDGLPSDWRRVVEGAADMLGESAKQHRVRGDTATAAMCDQFGAMLRDEILSASVPDERELTEQNAGILDMMAELFQRLSWGRGEPAAGQAYRECASRCRVVATLLRSGEDD